MYNLFYYGAYMNIFVLNQDPVIAAQEHCDKHCVKMVLELYQQLGSALRRHGATDSVMPVTQKGTPLKGGYHNHPCTRWVGDSRKNFAWACEHAIGLAEEYTYRYGKRHACHDGILKMQKLAHMIPHGKLTAFAQAMPDEYRNPDAVTAYKSYYVLDKYKNIQMTWTKRKCPNWFKERDDNV